MFLTNFQKVVKVREYAFYLLHWKGLLFDWAQ